MEINFFLLYFTEVMLPDPRTIHFLENQLRSQIHHKNVKELAAGLVLKEVHRDEITYLHDRLTQLQRAINSRKLTKVNEDCRSPEFSSPRPTSAVSRAKSATRAPSRLKKLPEARPPSASLRNSVGSPPVWDVPTRNDEMENIIKQKDGIIKRKDEEYNKLRKVLEDTQNDLQSVLDLNAQYLGIISHYNQLQRTSVQTPRMMDKSDAMLELEQKLDEAHMKIDELTSELTEISTELDEKQDEVDKLRRREERYKELLGISEETDENAIEHQIQKLMEDGEMAYQELEKIKKELYRTREAKVIIEDKISTLNREKDKIEFHLRQQEMTLKKMKRQRGANQVIHEATEMLPGYEDNSRIDLRLPAISRAGSQLALSARGGSKGSHMYCMFCRQEFFPLKSQVTCRVHYRPIRGGKWTCCKDDSHRSAGCIQVPHFYIEISVDRKIFLTDGQRYMELT